MMSETCSFCDGQPVVIANIVDNGQVATILFCENHKLNYAAPSPLIQFVLNETYREDHEQEGVDDMVDMAFYGL
jgi:hypothetical protein